MEFLIIGVLALVATAIATAVSPRVGIAAPLMLVALGFGASLLPVMPEVHINPEVILAGVLPPLLFAAGASIPATDFRREFRSISGLSVLLTVLSTAVLGVFFHAVIDDLSWAWSFALGAIVSPSDPVATSIIKRLGVAPRVVSLLEGESLLNDACALVLLRAAVVAAATTVTVWDVALEFILAMTVAVIIGIVVGRLNLWVSNRISDTTANTVFTLAVPFLASIPAEAVGASGLVAAVVCGLVTGNGAAKALSPQVRLSDAQTWKAIELVLEGAVYLIVGLELLATVREVQHAHAGVGFAVGVASVTIVLVLVVRAGFIGPLLAVQAVRARRAAAVHPRVEQMRSRLDDPSTQTEAIRHVRVARGGMWGRRIARRRLSREHVDRHLTRIQADAHYLARTPLGPREGALMVWAGMRGVVTVAAAQTLPTDTPERALLVLIAYTVAVGSLVLQGGTVAWLVALLKPSRGASAEEIVVERAQLQAFLDDAVERPEGVGGLSGQVAVIEAKRAALIDARKLGIFSSALLSSTLESLDAEQIRLEL